MTLPPLSPQPAWLLTLALTAGLACLPAHGQDAGKALNLLGSFLRQAAPAEAPAPAQPSTPGGMLGNMLGASFAPAGAGQAARAGDLIGLLSQSLEQIDEPREIEIGRQLAAVLLGSKPLHPDMALQRYVNQLGRWISLQSSRPQLPWTFAVLDDAGFNAFAAPGGYVFVTKGLIERVADEAELAGILAHEITHVTARHHLQAIAKTARAGLLTQVVGSQVKGQLAGAVSAQFLSLGRDLYSRGLDQSDEFDADRSGVALAARAGFDPYGLVAVLQQLRTATPDNPLFALSLSTHPPAQQRLDLLEQAMGNRMDGLSGQQAVTVAQRMERLAASRTASSSNAPAAAAPAGRRVPVKK
ncbi:MAG: M48 family metalloprotease [Polaromonas sp.]|uniref:M48 family metalloprotease n=1 Tax=Polaromonas sp. TaxID=1869339 RepID=UPI0024878A7E|nr:M48 family metalloprotease [Polaromonas sp.]MDI1237087.1 M48 family metalloprotease [Polaromonas sp.]MDI1338189.1 M48 family metalloprotease [Polaromonas sp.]